ncbi:hypothetical protein AQUCO_02500021v1 [Aquilegia coerulea]|uniref:Uncharacterized protein n=1 Tax=Aquilegia coerulea TaxID=218851 RepID=A0A2G5D909_AQUCA|nr:hypothetical protein AQUCO_02500021v1 [Aquilegia coerulea]
MFVHIKDERAEERKEEIIFSGIKPSYYVVPDFTYIYLKVLYADDKLVTDDSLVFLTLFDGYPVDQDEASRILYFLSDLCFSILSCKNRIVQ